ncbi:MAG: F0F1 ATP synthase subunit epsilon [Patescibacteria group bacterium]|nr:F0F1 ATP synthase subunit epsilon [Patescibacteria group bacterium]
MAKINFQIVTPERVVYNDEIDQVSLPTPMGEITVLPHHVPLITALSAGELRVKKGTDEVPMAISAGFAEIQPNKVVVLAETAERAEEIDIERAKEAHQKAEELLKTRRTDQKEFAAVMSKIEKELARLRVAERHRTKRADRVIREDELKKKQSGE